MSTFKVLMLAKHPKDYSSIFNKIIFQVECETARQMLQFLILGTSTESYSGLDLWVKYGEMCARNQSAINRLEKLREPVENIRRDLNSDLSSDLYEKFVEVNRLLQSLQDGMRVFFIHLGKYFIRQIRQHPLS